VRPEIDAPTQVCLKNVLLPPTHPSSALAKRCAGAAGPTAVAAADDVGTVNSASYEEREMGRTKLFELRSPETESARAILKSLLPLMPAPARDSFVAEDKRHGLYVAGDGSASWIWTGDLGGGWCVSTYDDKGIALLMSPDEQVSILRPGWRIT